MQLIVTSLSWTISDWLLRDSKQFQQTPFQVIQLHQHWDICQHRYFLATEEWKATAPTKITALVKQAQTIASLIAPISSVPLPWPHFLPPSLTHTVLGLPRKGRDALLSSHVDKMSHVNKSKGSVGDVGCMLQVNSFTHHLVDPLTRQHLLTSHLTTKALFQRGTLWMIFVQEKRSCWHWELQPCCCLVCGALLEALKSQCGCNPITLMSNELHGGVGAISSNTFALPNLLPVKKERSSILDPALMQL